MNIESKNVTVGPTCNAVYVAEGGLHRFLPREVASFPGSIADHIARQTEPARKPVPTDWRHFSVTAIAAENKAVAEYIAKLEGQVVSGFFAEYVPTFRQGVPKHTFEEPVDAEDCAAMVHRIAQLQAKLAEAEVWYREDYPAEDGADIVYPWDHS